MRLSNNRDVMLAAGVDQCTSIDKFFDMQGRSTFLTLDDIFEEAVDNIEVLHDGCGLVTEDLNANGVLYGDEEVLVTCSEDADPWAV